MTIRLPMEPRLADAPTPLGTVAKVGVGLDGVPIFADAPSMLERDHLPALDVCGGHIDPGGWYHWHATATDMTTVLGSGGVEADCAAVAQDAAAPFGFAFDGFPQGEAGRSRLSGSTGFIAGVAAPQDRSCRSNRLPSLCRRVPRGRIPTILPPRP